MSSDAEGSGGAVSAVVVQYRGRGAIGRCVRSCLDAGVAEVIVVDNEGVGADLRAAFTDQRVRVVSMPGNVGYGRAANAGLELARHDAALVLNQDTELSADALDRLLEAGLGARAWVAGPVLIGPDGRDAEPKTRFPPPLSWEAPGPEGPGWRWVPWVSGAAMLFLPGHADLRFDPRLFMYAEDEELCWRVWNAGGRVALVEDARIRHEGGTATPWGRTTVVARTLANRARMVGWHAGWRAMPAFVGGELVPRALRRGGVRRG